MNALFSSFGKVQNSCDYFWSFTQNPELAVFPQIFTKYIHQVVKKTIRRVRQMYVNCSPLFATFAIRSPNISQVVSNSPIDRHARQLVTKCLPNRHKAIIWLSPNDH